VKIVVHDADLSHEAGKSLNRQAFMFWRPVRGDSSRVAP